MKIIDSFILYPKGDHKEIEQQDLPIRRTTYPETDKPFSSELLRDIAGRADSDYILLTWSPVDFGLFAIERMAGIAEDTQSGMVYADFYEEKDGAISKHPLIDYRKGSLRDDFDFGPVLMFDTVAFKEAVEGMTGDYSFAGLYDLRLAISRRHPVVHINEYLYTVKENRAKTEGGHFAYVDPKHRAVQIEMETALTGHLRLIGAHLPPRIKSVDIDEDTFPVEASVIIPVRNRVKTIADAIRSAQAQETAFGFNVILVDNHSTDGTTQVIGSHAVKDGRLVHIIPGQGDLGIGGCWNLAVNHDLCGRFAVQLDSDDVFSGRHTLQTIVDAFRRERCAMLIGSYRLTDFNLQTIPPGLIDHSEWTHENGHNNALRINGFGAPRAFFTPLLRKIKLPNTSYGEDYAVCLRISREYRTGRLYEALYFCRRWEGNSDAAPALSLTNEYNSYKDNLRSWELEARIKMNNLL
ncbi:MAG: glycosyltransferase family 2 protein [Tannerellaceae bacterium]|jgi:hypothetical protein|nr:glycosyltransferase family 2 protein [Tannerellaceae bacterium]